MNNLNSRYQKVIRRAIFFGFCLLVGCQPTSNLTGKNISQLYRLNDQLEEIKVDYKMLHLEGGKSELMFNLDLSALTKSEGVNSFSIRYRLYQNYSASVPIDSGFQVFKDIYAENNFEGVIQFSIPPGRNYMLEIDLIDLFSKKRNRGYLDVINPQQFSKQSFLVKRNDESLLYQNHVVVADSYLISAEPAIERLFVRFYNRNFPVASPPFSAVNNKPFDFNPDKLIELAPNTKGDFVIYVAQSGIYQITIDTNSRNGGSLFYFGQYYPKAKTINDLLLPLRYISTTPEYQSLRKSEDLKKGIDNYWLKVGGNPQRAKMLIGTYYTRVEESNEMFESYIEGWKTDRGMCYIVFGPPNKVLRSTASETWLYGEEGRYNTFKLTFTKVQNPFTTNDFRLNRNASLKSPWYRAVEFWRQGRIITY